MASRNPQRRPGCGMLNRKRELPEIVTSDHTVNYGTSSAAEALKYPEFQNLDEPKIDIISRNLARKELPIPQVIQVCPIGEHANNITGEEFDIFVYLERIGLSSFYLVHREEQLKPGDKGVNDFDVGLADDRAKVSKNMKLEITNFGLEGKVEITNSTKMNLAYKFMCSEQSIIGPDKLGSMGWILPNKTVKFNIKIPSQLTKKFLNARIGFGVFPVYDVNKLTFRSIQKMWKMLATNTFGIMAEIHEIKMTSNHVDVGRISFIDELFGITPTLEISFDQIDDLDENDIIYYRFDLDDETRLKVDEYILVREMHRNIARGILVVSNEKPFNWNLLCGILFIVVLGIITQCIFGDLTIEGFWKHPGSTLLKTLTKGFGNCINFFF